MLVISTASRSRRIDRPIRLWDYNPHLLQGDVMTVTDVISTRSLISLIKRRWLVPQLYATLKSANAKNA